MEESITSQMFLDAIKVASIERYSVVQEIIPDDQISPVYEILNDRKILQLKRTNDESAMWKTVLICVIQNMEQFPTLLRWTADIKDDILDPGSSDLYLISALKDNNLSIESCTNIESNDQFCRKFILRANESIADLIERTFLSSLSDEVSHDEIVDPLYTALLHVSSTSNWFTSEIQLKWKSIFLSELSGSELIDKLFADDSINQENQ